MRVGIACPYAWDTPGGVQFHIRDLAQSLLRLGHDVSVISPAADDASLPSYVVPAGRAMGLPYNGSVARLLFGPVSAHRVRRWLRDGHFDVLHVQEPAAPSVSLLACYLASGPIVATFHSANPRSRLMLTAEPLLTPALEKIRGRIAVSPGARRTIVEHFGGDAVVIPNGVEVGRFAGAEPLAGHPDGRTVAFVGRIDEPRKGLAVLLEALPALARARPDVRLVIAGPGDVEDVMELIAPEVADRVEFLGLVSEEQKARLLASADVFCAPNLGGESFGVVLLEAASAGAPVVATDLEAFRLVLDDGRAGRLVRVGDPTALASALAELLADPAARADLAARGRAVAAKYDWSVVVARIVQVYETVMVEPGRVALDRVATPGE